MNKEIEIPEGYGVRIEGNKVILELKESKDEKAYKRIEQLIRLNTSGAEKTHLLAYLENQKVLAFAPKTFEDAVEQMYTEVGVCQLLWRERAAKLFELAKKELEQKPAEWSEEDIDKMVTARARKSGTTKSEMEFYRQGIKDTLKSFRPQSKEETYKEKDEAFKLGKHQLAIRFINYLDENRPEGKMSLSNAECDDIVKAFKENDWPKIMRYVRKYSWKPSEEQS